MDTLEKGNIRFKNLQKKLNCQNLIREVASDGSRASAYDGSK